MTNGMAVDEAGLAAPQHIQNTHSPVDACLKPAEAAAALNVSIRTLENWRRWGNGPPFVRLSKVCVRYPVPGLQRFIADRTFTSTAAETAEG